MGAYRTKETARTPPEGSQGELDCAPITTATLRALSAHPPATLPESRSGFLRNSEGRETLQAARPEQQVRKDLRCQPQPNNQPHIVREGSSVRWLYDPVISLRGRQNHPRSDISRFRGADERKPLLVTGRSRYY